MLWAVPPLIWPTWTVVKGGSKMAATGFGGLARLRAFISLTHSISLAPSMIALTPSCSIEEWTS